MANTVLGRDYVNARGGTSGTVPAFDANADRNHDGYLSDTEYAYRRGGSDARFEYESRLFYPAYGQMRFATNPADGGFRNWAVDYARRFLAANPGADGLFLDNSYGRLQVDARILREPMSQVRRGLRVPGGQHRVRDRNEVGAGEHGRQRRQRRPAGPVRNLVRGGVRPAAAGPHLAALHRHGGPDGPATAPDGRERLRDPRHLPGRRVADRPADADRGAGVLLPAGRPGQDVRDVQRRVRAVERRGRGTGPTRSSTTSASRGAPWSVFAQGKDPERTYLDYKVYQRTYDRALVLYKPLSYTAGGPAPRPPRHRPGTGCRATTASCEPTARSERSSRPCACATAKGRSWCGRENPRHLSDHFSGLQYSQISDAHPT